MSHQQRGAKAGASDTVHVLDLQEIVSKDPEAWTPEEFDFLLWATPHDEREQVRAQYEKLMYLKAQTALEELKAAAPEPVPTFDDYFDDQQEMRPPVRRAPGIAGNILCALIGFLCAGLTGWLMHVAGRSVAPWAAGLAIYAGLCAPWGLRSLARGAKARMVIRRKKTSHTAIWLMQWLLRVVMCGFVGMIALPTDLVRHFRYARRTGSTGSEIVAVILMAASFVLPLSFLCALTNPVG